MSMRIFIFIFIFIFIIDTLGERECVYKNANGRWVGLGWVRRIRD